MTENIVYDDRFNGNEWFVIGMIALSAVPIWLCPRRFSPVQTLFNLLIGASFPLILDHSIGVPPFDFYDWGDESAYQPMDLLFYVMYAPFGYWFIYGYERFRMYGMMAIVYILLWTGLSLGFEWMGVEFGAFHYKNGYQWRCSIPFYLFLMSIQLMLYRMAFAPSRWRRRSQRLQ